MVKTGQIVILLENLPVERDRRVWRQARALVEAGIPVTVICPRLRERSGASPWEVRTVDGVEIRSFAAARERSGVTGFVWEYLLAWVQMVWILLIIHRRTTIAGIQACNPPDIFFPLAWWARRRDIPFVFDQHDLCPELFLTRVGLGGFGGQADGARLSALQRVVLGVLRRCERESHLGATRVIATNESYRRVAVDRGGRVPADVVVVRNGPDRRMMEIGTATAPRADREGDDGQKLVVWMGNIGPQDGVDDAVRAVAHLVHHLGRTDTRVVFIGRGEARADAMDLVRELGVERHVTFTGWIPDAEAFALLAAADVGLSADPPGPLNDKSTMNKTLEYMAFGLPIVAHDLCETRVSAGEAAVYAPEPTPESLAECLHELLSDNDRLMALGREGRRRIENGLGWPHQAEVYVTLWRSLLTGDLPANTDEANDPTTNRYEVVV